MKKFFVILGVILVVFLLLMIPFGMYVSYSNNFVRLNNEVEAQYKQIDNALQRRYDLIPNLVNTVKGYAKHEKDVFTNLDNARNQLIQANGVKEKAAATGGFESAFGRLLAVVENYPQLKANEQFNNLMYELSGTENRLSVERKRYNDVVKNYNNAIQLFPGSIFAGMKGLKVKDYFEIPQAARENPTVNFE